MPSQITDAPGMRMYYQDSLAYEVEVFIIFGLVAVLITLYKLYRKDTTQREKYFLLVGWAIIPPVWFVIEYFFVFLPYGAENSFKFFDYGQSVASKLWGAVSTLIALVIYKDSEKEKEDKAERKEKEDAEDLKAKPDEFE